MTSTSESLSTGVAAGVPYVIVAPDSGRTNAPIVVAWHLVDPPRTEVALAAALPLAGLDAWRIYLGLPLCGSRKPPGGDEEFMQLGMADAVRHLYGPMHRQAVAEFEPALAELRERHQLTGQRVGLLGGSAGASVVMGVLVTTQVPISAAVLVNPLTQVPPVVAGVSKMFGIDYEWSDDTRAIAAQMDFVARAAELVATGVPIRIVLGADDDADMFHHPARALHALLSAGPTETSLKLVPDLAHNLSEPPGDVPTPQLPGAVECDRLAVEWLTARIG